MHSLLRRQLFECYKLISKTYTILVQYISFYGPLNKTANLNAITQPTPSCALATTCECFKEALGYRAHI